MTVKIPDIKDIKPGYATFIKACDVIRNSDPECMAEACGYADMTADINISDIISKMLFCAGRYCDRYLGDILYDFASIVPFAKEPSTGPARWVITVGLRENGVDSAPAVMCKLKESRSGPFRYVRPQYEYRKILAVDIRDEIRDGGNIYRTMALKDITNKITAIASEDEETD